MSKHRRRKPAGPPPLDDESPEVITAVRKMRAYDDLNKFTAEIDALIAISNKASSDAHANGVSAIVLLPYKFVSDLALMLTHTRMQIEVLKKAVEELRHGPA